MEDLGRPQRDDHVGDAAERGHRQPRCQLVVEVGSLGVVAAEERLDVRETGPVLDVEERPTVAVDGHEVCPAGELVVLIRLVEADLEAQRAEVGRLQLAEGRMDEIGITRCGASLRREEREAGFQAKGARQAGVADERGGLAGLDAVDHRGRDTRGLCKARLGPAATDPFRGDLRAQLDGRTADDGGDTGRGWLEAPSWRHLRMK